MAARLSEDPSRTVLLLEAGPAISRAEYPSVLADPERIGGDQEHDWGFRARVGHCGPLDREIAVPRGKVLGGTSAVNAAVALRALPSDFAAWTADGLARYSTIPPPSRCTETSWRFPTGGTTSAFRRPSGRAPRQGPPSTLSWYRLTDDHVARLLTHRPSG
jgi:choline dehydrogenase-like flavoprotein